MKINKDLLPFVVMLTTLLSVVAFVAHKFLPLLFQRTVYYCEAVVRSVMVHTSSQLGIWVAAGLVTIMVLAIVKILVTYWQVWRFRQTLKISQRSWAIFDDLCAELHITGQASVIENHQPFAICFGIRRPHIYVSSGLLALVTKSELKAVLLHELYHLEHHDALTLLVASCTQLLFPFMPVCSDLVSNFRIERELQADRFAVQKLKTEKPLLRVLKKLLLCDESPALAFMPSLAEYQTLEIRIHALLRQPVTIKRYRLLPMMISGVSLMILAALVVTPVHALESRDELQNVPAVCLHSGQCEVLCRQTQASKAYTPWVKASYID